MANPKSPVLRIVVPLILAGLGVVIAWSVWKNTMRTAAPAQPATPAVTPGSAAAGTPATSGTRAGEQAAPAEPVAADGTAPAATPAPPEPAPPLVGLRVRDAEGGMDPGSMSPIGSLDPASGYKLRLQFNPLGAGIESIELTDHFETVDRVKNDTVQQSLQYTSAEGLPVSLPPFAATRLDVNGQNVILGLRARRVWREIAPGHFEAIVEDGSGNAVLRIVRQYHVERDQYHVRLEQRVENVSGQPLRVKWFQYGPVSMPRGAIGYGGDPRRVRFGYLLSPASSPSQQRVEAARFLMPQSEVVAASRGTYPDKVLWPNPTSTNNGLSLVFAAVTHRYMAAAVFPLFDPSATLPDKRLHAVETVDRFVIPTPPDRANSPPPVVLRLISPETALAPGQSADLSMGLYAGPMSREYTDRQPLTRLAGLGELVVYTFGGPCAFCTFQSLTYGLLSFLRLLHSYLVFDWALAIIVLVFVVRVVLHPVTKWSQVSMYRFGKQMQSLAPKQKKLQEKYKDDPKKMREEMARMMREENINYAGALGCLPMFLQMPIWIALFAMLFFAFDLRHEGAFFGLFQAITGGGWHFMADLAEPDRFVPLGISIWIPWVSTIMGPIVSVNLLPLLLGVVFYIQQKYLTPPTTMTMTPEQEAQQKMIKVMMVIMFPLFMYNAPSGLALYFITNSTLAIIESRHIRKHAEKLDAEKAARIAAGIEKPGRKATDRKPGFFQRVQEQIEARRKMIEQVQKQQNRGQRRDDRGRGGGPPGKKR